MKVGEGWKYGINMCGVKEKGIGEGTGIRNQIVKRGKERRKEVEQSDGRGGVKGQEGCGGVQGRGGGDGDGGDGGNRGGGQRLQHHQNTCYRCEDTWNNESSSIRCIQGESVSVINEELSSVINNVTNEELNSHIVTEELKKVEEALRIKCAEELMRVTNSVKHDEDTEEEDVECGEEIMRDMEEEQAQEGLEKIATYDYTVHYVLDRMNRVADGLSRQREGQCFL